MKKLIKFLIVLLLSIIFWWLFFTQTERGTKYAHENFSYDASLIKWKILSALNATGVVMTWTEIISWSEIQYSDTGAIVVDQSILDQRLNYYKTAKDSLWKK